MTLTISPESAREFAKLVAEELAAMQPSTKQTKLLMTCAEVGAELGLSDDTIRKLVNAGKIKRAKGIRQIRITPEALEEYLSVNR